MLRWLLSPDGLALIGTVAGWLGVRARGKRADATRAQIARYAKIAADATALAVRTGAIDPGSAPVVAVDRFRSIMTAAGLHVAEGDESEAITAVSEALTIAGRAALMAEAERLRVAADAALARMHARAPT